METRSVRPSLDVYFMSIAQATAARSTCPRAAVGCVLVRDKHILSTGHNGSMAGAAHCSDIGCLNLGGGCCRTIHAEVNAIIQAARHGVSTIGATAYCTHSPCRACMGALVNAGIVAIRYLEEYRISEHLQELAPLGVTYSKIVLES